MTTPHRPESVVALGPVPFHRFTGSAYASGEALGGHWRDVLRARAESPSAGAVPMLTTPAIVRLIERYAPVLIDLHRGLARGAGLRDDQLMSVFDAGSGLGEGCTSFAVQPSTSASGAPMAGQSKDTPADRLTRYEVLALETQEGFGLLTLTYPGWLFGHGFAVGGCAIFRNALHGGNPGGALPYDLWGLLAHTCPTVDHVRELTLKHGVRDGAHCVVSDERGGILGIEAGDAGYAFLEPEDGLYVHANHMVSGPPRLALEREPCYGWAGSLNRHARLQACLRARRGHLTPAGAFAAFGDHEGHPDSLCSDARKGGDSTTAAVVVEPLLRRLWACRGLPCCNPPVAYTLESIASSSAAARANCLT